MPKIKVLLVDDQVLFVKSLNIVLQKQSDMIEVVGVAYDGQSALEMTDELRPDLIFMDVRMPGVNGVECTKLVKENHPEVKVVMLTTFDDDEYVSDALRLGASGYLLKDMEPDELITAAMAVCHGGVMISPKVATKLAGKIGSAISNDKETQKIVKEEIRPSFRLSPREREILDLMCSNYGNYEIAEKLFISEQTVKNHISMIYDKLQVKDRFHAIRLWKGPKV